MSLRLAPDGGGPRSGKNRCLEALAAWILLGLQAHGATGQDRAEAEATERFGASIRVRLPITAEVAGRVEGFVGRALGKARQLNRRPVLILQFEIPDGQEEFAARTRFGDAYKLADFLSSDALNLARTVAYVPRALPGHAVLVALACDEIMMPGDAEIGPVDADPAQIGDPTCRSAYREIASRRKTVAPNVALWLLDPSLGILMVEAETGRQFLTPAELEELKQRDTIRLQQPLYEANADDSVLSQRGRITGDEARRLNFASYKTTRLADVAKPLKLPIEALQENKALVGDVKAVRVDLKGPISGKQVTQLERVIRDEVRLNEINFVCLWIDSPGGSPSDSISRLAGFLASSELDEVQTVAYVPSVARSDAALVALACDQVVMHPLAELGGSGAYSFARDEIELAIEAIRDPQGPWGARSWSLPAAMIDPNLEVFECTRPGEKGYFCQDELDERNGQLEAHDADAPKWQKGNPLTRRGTPFRTDGQDALKYGLVSHTVKSFAELKRIYDLQDDPKFVAPGWADFLIEALASPGVAGLLLMIGGAALYAELHAPGIGVGGFIAAVCFLLFFWSNYLGGTAGWLEVLLFAAGVCCLLLEVFVLPGFGVFGLGGGLLVLASLVLASQTFVLPDPSNEYQMARLERSLLTVVGAGAGIIMVAVLLKRWLPKAPIVSQVMLQPPEGVEADTIRLRETLADYENLLGTRGLTATQLTPGGKARFGDQLVDVITDGDVVARGRPIEVVEIHGNRIVVREVDSG